jgi:formylglycine-generating enzyme required for sulfatase activity
MHQGRAHLNSFKRCYQIVLVSLLTMLFASCENFGFRAEEQAATNSNFLGVQSISISPDGNYILVWDLASTTGDVNSVSYEVYMDKWNAIPSEVDAEANSLNAQAPGTVLGARFAKMPDQTAPVTKGILLGTVRGARSFTLDEKVQPHVIYAFQVRAVSGDGTRDLNEQVLIYSADFNSIGFDGVNGLEISPAGSILLSWNIPVDLPSGLVPSDLTYEVYMDSTPDSLEVATAGSIILNTGGSELALTSQNRIGVLAELPAEKLPSNSVAPLAEKKGGRFYEIENTLSPGVTYIFQVLVRGPNQESGISKRVIFYRAESLNFAGIKNENVTIAPDGSKISLSWEAATGSTKTVSYIVYSDANFFNAIATTPATTYDFMNPVKGQAYIFAVRAKDGSTLDTNKEFVVVSVPDPSDKTSPEFAGISTAEVASDKKIVLKWNASTSDDVAIYNIYYAYNLNQPIASTTQTSFTVTGLTPATSYSFIVRAKDASGNEEKNTVQKTAMTLSYVVPDFSGIFDVARLGGVDGLSKLKISWQPAGGTVTGYKVFMASSAAGIDFNSAIETVADANATDVVISGLDINTSYHFVVRAYNISGGITRSEQNTIVKSDSTLAVNPPTFTGIAGAAPGAGSLAFTTVKATWLSPSTDGVYDSFVVEYESGACAAGFSSTPTSVVVNGDSSREHTVTGLTAQTTYRFRVKARYSLTGTKDSNTVCKEAYTSPAAPTFSGIGTLTIAAGTSGFNSLTATWPAASGSFSYYKIDWSTSSTFATIGGTVQVNNIATLSRTLTGLPAKTTVFVRISAVFDESGVQLSSGINKSLSASTTPVAPVGDGIDSVAVMSADSLKVNWAVPTNAMSAVFNGYKLWKFCGASAPTSLLAKVTGNADHTYPTGQLSATFNGLASNTECCYQVRAFYDDGVNTLASGNSVTSGYQCKTPTLTPPTFSGVTTAANSNAANGFTQLTVSWTPVDASEAGLFSYYEIAYATTPNGHNWTAGTIQVVDRATSQRVVTGLAENTVYYFRVRAVNNNGTPAVSNGADAVASATTTPKVPTGDNLSAALSIGSTKARLTYAPPNSVPSSGGLFNNIFLFVQAGSTTDVTTFKSSVESSGVANGEIQGSLAAGKITLTSLPALVRVPMNEVTSDQNNLYEIWGLTANQQVCVQALAVYWVDGQTSKYLISSTPTTRCVTPTAGAPTFAGVTGLTGFNDSRDFSQMTVSWGAVSGDCTNIEVSATTTPNAPDFTTPKASLTCSETSVTLGGLLAHTEYFIQVRAKNVVGGQTFAAGQGVEFSRVTSTTIPTGDGMSAVTAVAQAKGPDRADLTFAQASAGVWNKTYIWRSTNVSQATAQAAVLAKAATKSDKSGPTSPPDFNFNAGTTSTTDSSLTAGLYACYVAKAVYDDGSNYKASASETVRCDRPSYTTPTFSGVSSASVIGTWPDGTAKVELTFANAPVGSIEEYWVYFSPSSTLSSFGDLTAEPWQKIDVADATYDSNQFDNKILFGGQGRTVIGAGYYVVRYKFYSGPDSDSNTSISTAATVSESQGNLVYVPPSFSGLSYGYYIMQYEASLGSGSLNAGDAVSSSESDLATCNYQFRLNPGSLHASCGTRLSSATFTSKKAVSPVATNWHQAWVGCRVSGTSGVGMRLATEDEWRRASRFLPTSYSDLLTVTQSGTGANCNVTGGAASVTGNAASCKNSLGIFDMAGNQSEWADTLMSRYSIDDPNGDGTGVGFDTDTERRFSYGPTIGRSRRNGIDNISRRYHLIDPGASGLALSLGANWVTPSPADLKQYGAGQQSWVSPSSTGTHLGVRCVAFAASTMPTAEKFALPMEPVYASSDIAGAASTWTIPENLYVKDVRPESVAIELTGNITDSVAEGRVKITWKPWSTRVCNPTCGTTDTGVIYRIYRFVEPTRSSKRFTTSWALAGGTNPYAADSPLDPLAVAPSGATYVPLYTDQTTTGRLVATVTNCDSSNTANCIFTDSDTAGTGFSTLRVYNYVVVGESPTGNLMPAMSQRFRTPYLTGAAATAGAATFRQEVRFRRAAVFLVDEAHQQSKTLPQIMVHVPMDKSGLDHDFFIQKYEGALYDGSVSNNSPAGASDWPLQGSNGTWSANAAKCGEQIRQTGAFAGSCGNGTVVSATSARVQSKQGVAPLVNIDQGAFWKACRNSGFSDGDGNTYYLDLPTDSEWLKAADWGDLNHDGTIDRHEALAALEGQTVSSIEQASNGTGGDTCHTDNNPGSAYNSNSATTAKCRSRYGVADVVGNVWEWTLGQIYNGVGYDNGADGLWFEQGLPTTQQNVSVYGRYDLFRGYPKSAGAPAIADNGDYYWYSSALRGPLRGGSWGNSSFAGRWSLLLNNAPSSSYSHLGGRCRR